jgi:endogenous inhibitor of DNA gyrase (YacG/DUF329 family)
MIRIFRVMVRCPTTGKAIETGIETTSQDEFSRTYEAIPPADCPHCGQTHRWKKEDAFLLVDDDPSTPRALWRPNR